MTKLILAHVFAITAIFYGASSYSQQVISFSPIPQKAELFGGSAINTRFSERDFALSPNGKEIFYTLQAPAPGGFQTIVWRRKNENGTWSTPELAPFAGKFNDLEPCFSPDGNRLYFSSNRPREGTTSTDFDIWYSEKKAGKWSEPINLGEPVNTTKDEFYPSVTNSGNLYFTAAYSNAVGREDIYMAAYSNGKYAMPAPLDSAVNTKTYEFNAYVSPDEKFIIFTSYGRKDDMGGGDLYMSIKDDAGNWKPARHLTELNSPRIDYCPFVSFDKKILFFTSERNLLPKSYPKGTSYNELIKLYNSPTAAGGNIYWISFEKILKGFTMQ